MKRKFTPLPDTDATSITPVIIAGELPITWRNRHGFIVVERCYSGASARWTVEHRENVLSKRFNSASEG